jgi:hypothetical protein
MIDAVYVLGTGSRWFDNELRYSLRSIEQFVTGIRNVYLVGRAPKWINNVIHIPYDDLHACKEKNIMEKVLRVCQEADLSEQFLHLHDDHFALAPTAAEAIPYWYRMDLDKLAERVPPSNNYRNALLNTFAVLMARRLPFKNYDLHFPIVYDKELFPLAMMSYNWEACYVVKSLYSNTVGVQGETIADIKINGATTMRDIVDRIKGRPWFSIGPAALNQNMKELLQALYPDKSKWEK